MVSQDNCLFKIQQAHINDTTVDLSINTQQVLSNASLATETSSLLLPHQFISLTYQRALKLTAQYPNQFSPLQDNG